MLQTSVKEACVRVEQTARKLGYLLALVDKGQIPGDRHALFRSLLLFHNRPVYFSGLSPRRDFMLQSSRNEIYEHVSKLAEAMGPVGLGALRDVVMELTSGPSAAQFSPFHRRYFAQLFYDEDVIPRDEAVSLGLSSTADADDDDPGLRQESCLEIAAFLHEVGDKTGTRNWTRRASKVSAGAGSHKDYHMAYVAKWLARSLTQVDSDFMEILDLFVRAVEVAGGRGGPDGAATVLKLLLRLSPAKACQLAREFMDRDVLSVSNVLEALITGGADAGGHPELLSAMYGEFYALIAPHDTYEVATAVLAAFQVKDKKEAAERLMSYVRTNALPSHRVPVARALEEAIRKAGAESITLTKGLKPGYDDSSRKSMLYQLASGDVETRGQVAELLSDPDAIDIWNPNPGDNAEFDWWEAIKQADIKDHQHFDSLVARFPPSEYREVEVLVRRAEILANSGNRGAARELIEQATTLSRDGSWHRWLDSARKVMAFRALKKVDHAEGLERAREQFPKDVGAGKISPLLLLSDAGDILEVLEVDWPAEAVLEAIKDYLKQVLAANPPIRSYDSLAGSVALLVGRSGALPICSRVPCVPDRRRWSSRKARASQVPVG